MSIIHLGNGEYEGNRDRIVNLAGLSSDVYEIKGTDLAEEDEAPS